MTRALLLGGAGFIGYHLARHLVDCGDHEITIVDNFFRGRRDQELDALLKHSGVNAVEADLSDVSSYRRLDDNYDHVYALAAIVGVGYTRDVPEEVWRTNTAITLHTLN